MFNQQLTTFISKSRLQNSTAGRSKVSSLQQQQQPLLTFQLRIRAQRKVRAGAFIGASRALTCGLLRCTLMKAARVAQSDHVVDCWRENRFQSGQTFNLFFFSTYTIGATC